jgi:hypothetical protein
MSACCTICISEADENGSSSCTFTFAGAFFTGFGFAFVLKSMTKGQFAIVWPGTPHPLQPSVSSDAAPAAVSSSPRAFFAGGPLRKRAAIATASKARTPMHCDFLWFESRS